MAITLDNPALFLNPDKIVEELNAFNTADQNADAVGGAVASDATTNNLTHDSIYNTIKRSIISAVAKKKTYTIIPFAHFSPHTQEDIDLLLGDVNEARTSFTESKGRWYETFNNTFKKLKYEYIFCYYRNEPLPFGVMVSWDKGTGTTGDVNLKEANTTYARFVYPKYYFFYPDVETTRTNAENGSTDLTITEIIGETLTAVTSKINESIALNKKYAIVFWEDIDIKNADYIKSQFYTSGTTDKEHTWSSTEEIALFADATANNRLRTIDNGDTFTMRGIVMNNHNSKAYGYRAIKNTKNEVIGFLVSWHDKNTESSIQTEIDELINSFKTDTQSEASAVITLPIYNTLNQKTNRGVIRKNMRVSYLETISKKIQEKMSNAFNNSARDSVLLWTEVSSSKADSVRTEWRTKDTFGKPITTQDYAEDDNVTPAPVSNASRDFSTVFKELDVMYYVHDDVSNSEQVIYWDYIHYKGTTIDSSNRALRSCGIALYYHNNIETAKTQLQKIVDEYLTKEDPAKK